MRRPSKAQGEEFPESSSKQRKECQGGGSPQGFNSNFNHVLPHGTLYAEKEAHR